MSRFVSAIPAKEGKDAEGYLGRRRQPLNRTAFSRYGGARWVNDPVAQVRAIQSPSPGKTYPATMRVSDVSGTGYLHLQTSNNAADVGRYIQMAHSATAMATYLKSDFVQYSTVSFYGYVAGGWPAASTVAGDFIRVGTNFGIRSTNTPSSISYNAFESVNSGEQTGEQFDPAGFRTRLKMDAAGVEMRYAGYVYVTQSEGDKPLAVVDRTWAGIDCPWCNEAVTTDYGDFIRSDADPSVISTVCSDGHYITFCHHENHQGEQQHELVADLAAKTGIELQVPHPTLLPIPPPHP